MEGWISLHRRFLEWEWFTDEKMVKLFIFLLLKANRTDGKWQGINIKRGQLLTGINSLHLDTKISKQSLRTCLLRLKKTGEINIQSTNKYSIITVCNYDSYQDNKKTTNKQTNKQLTINQQATNKQLTTNNTSNTYNKDNKEDYIIRELQFKKDVYKLKYKKETLESFFDYWSEPNRSKSKMKFEQEKTWDLSRRLKRWSNNNFNKVNEKEAQPKITIDR